MVDESKKSLSTTRKPLTGSKPVSALTVQQHADAFLKKVRELGSSQAGLAADDAGTRAAHLCHGRHFQPPAHMGHGG
jgi:hypothetical protein